jgi:hypothetical protein
LRPLIDEKINSKLDEIVTMCFLGNRIMDRGMSILGVKFAMNKTESLLHSKLAHLFPVLADDVSGYQGNRNNFTVYGVTPEAKDDYKNPLEFFEKILDYMVDLESLVEEVYNIAKDEDFTTASFLQSFILKLIPVSSQCLLLVDKMEMYKDDIVGFDRDIDNFVIL